MKAVVAAFNQEKALVGAFSVITNFRMDLCFNLYTQDRKRDRSRDNFLDDEPEISTLKPRTNNRRRILKKTDEKKNIGNYWRKARKTKS